VLLTKTRAKLHLVRPAERETLSRLAKELGCERRLSAVSEASNALNCNCPPLEKDHQLEGYRADRAPVILMLWMGRLGGDDGSIELRARHPIARARSATLTLRSSKFAFTGTPGCIGPIYV
jgi:hypothetical protein